MEDQTRSLSEVAGLMGVSERTVRRWIKAGRLKAYKPGRDYRIQESDLRAFIEESEVSPKEPAPPSLEPTFNDVLEEERRAITYVRPWFRTLSRFSRRLEELASPGKFDAGEFTASGEQLRDIMAGLNMQLRELKSRGIDPKTGLIGEELRESMLRLASAQRASAEAALQVLTKDELARTRRRRAEWEGDPEELVRKAAE